MDNQARGPLALIASADEWLGRSFETVFEQNGYLVERVSFGKRALDLARRAHHDVVVLDQGLEDLGGVEICRALRDDPLFDHCTPIVIITTGHVTAQARLAAYTAGAWEYCSQLVDCGELFLKLGTFLRPRRELVVAQSQRLVDPESGFYTSFGLQQVAGQLSARAARNHEAFACVAFSPTMPDREVPGKPVTREDGKGFADFANVFREQSRKSDVVGRMGESRLAILAPDTDAAGARLLVARLQRQLDDASKNSIGGDVRLRAGYCAVSDFASANVNLEELVQRAESALDHVQIAGGDQLIVNFDELPLS